MFFEMLFAILISFAIGVLATIVTLAYLVINGDLIIERTADKEKRRKRKQEKRERKRERKEKEKEMEKEKNRRIIPSPESQFSGSGFSPIALSIF